MEANGTVLYLHSGNGYYTTVGVYRNTQNCTLKRMNFTVCRLYLNKE